MSDWEEEEPELTDEQRARMIRAACGRETSMTLADALVSVYVWTDPGLEARADQ